MPGDPQNKEAAGLQPSDSSLALLLQNKQTINQDGKTVKTQCQPVSSQNWHMEWPDLAQADTASVALGLAKQGISVLPLKADKTPALRSWSHLVAEPMTPAQVQSHWEKHPHDSVGYIVGGQFVPGFRLMVIDSDPRNYRLAVDGVPLPFELQSKTGHALERALLEPGVTLFDELQFLQDEHGELPKTTTTRTGGLPVAGVYGQHRLFLIPETAEIPASGCVSLGSGKAVDARLFGVYCVGATSRHPSGRTYEWEGDPAQPVAVLPEAWLDLINKHKEPTTRTTTAGCAGKEIRGSSFDPAPAAVQQEFIELFASKGLHLQANRQHSSLLCVFHNDTKGSLSVNTAAAVYNCRGCGASGGIKKLRHLLGVVAVSISLVPSNRVNIETATNKAKTTLTHPAWWEMLSSDLGLGSRALEQAKKCPNGVRVALHKPSTLETWSVYKPCRGKTCPHCAAVVGQEHATPILEAFRGGSEVRRTELSHHRHDQMRTQLTRAGCEYRRFPVESGRVVWFYSVPDTATASVPDGDAYDSAAVLEQDIILAWRSNCRRACEGKLDPESGLVSNNVTGSKGWRRSEAAQVEMSDDVVALGVLAPGSTPEHQLKQAEAITTGASPSTVKDERTGEVVEVHAFPANQIEFESLVAHWGVRPFAEVYAKRQQPSSAALFYRRAGELGNQVGDWEAVEVSS